MTEQDKYELSITKKYKKSIWSRFIKGIKEYQLISENDKIAVCISGGRFYAHGEMHAAASEVQ